MMEYSDKCRPFTKVLHCLLVLQLFFSFHLVLTCRVIINTCPDVQEVTSKSPHGDCPGFRFPCQNSSQCVPGNFICNGISDCDNGSDELPEECATNNPLYTNIWTHIYGSERRGGDGDSSDEDFNPDNVCENGTYPPNCTCYLKCISRHGGNADDGECESEVFCYTENTTGFTTVPRDLPTNTVLLDLSDNYISVVRKGDLDHLPYLRTLYFSRNRNLRFESDALTNNLTISELNLVGCQMGTIPDGLFSGMSHLMTL
ncbi:sortilin-related receptor-like [Anneissia japonica]|uniref:sortilin-related receptor-like n=1 Tax=Anneissia japonica TaxID=1529436 RepID=UPI0014259BC1|nr:sortilin-related receptor-like [Anneissia japonica]